MAVLKFPPFHRIFKTGIWDTRHQSSAVSELFSSYNRTQFVERAAKVPRLRRTANKKDAATEDPTKKAAVLVPLISLHGEPGLLFTARSTQLRAHAGEISYPGGKFDSHHDVTLEDTALRETEEELGIDRKSFEIWANLPPLPSKDGITYVTPFVALLKVPFDSSNLKLNIQEVSEVFPVPLAQLCLSSNQGFTQFRPGYTMPVYFYKKVGTTPKIWGLTAIITHQVLTTLMPETYKLKLKMMSNVLAASRTAGKP